MPAEPAFKPDTPRAAADPAAVSPLEGLRIPSTCHLARTAAILGNELWDFMDRHEPQPHQWASLLDKLHRNAHDLRPKVLRLNEKFACAGIALRSVLSDVIQRSDSPARTSIALVMLLALEDYEGIASNYIVPTLTRDLAYIPGVAEDLLDTFISNLRKEPREAILAGMPHSLSAARAKRADILRNFKHRDLHVVHHSVARYA